MQAALGQRPYLEVFGTRAHLAALEHLREGRESQVLNCGYGKGFSVLEVIAAVKRASGTDFAGA